jgi:hypothetical protein
MPDKQLGSAKCPWVKARKNLWDDEKTHAIALLVGLDVFATAGRLLYIWAWADGRLHEDRCAMLTPVWLDGFIRCPGFAQAMARVGWLVIEDDGLRFPNFGEHNWQDQRKKELAAARYKRYRTNKKSLAGGLNVDSDVARHVARHVDSDVETASHHSHSLNPSPTPSFKEGKEGDGIASLQGSPEPKTPPPIPPPPSPGKPAPNFRGTIADNPELAAVAKRIAAHYKDTVKAAHPEAGGVQAVLLLLLAGHTEQALRRSCDGYAAFCKKNDRDLKHRRRVSVFFAENGDYSSFLDYQPPPPAKPQQYTPPEQPLGPDGKPLTLNDTWGPVRAKQRAAEAAKASARLTKATSPHETTKTPPTSKEAV